MAGCRRGVPGDGLLQHDFWVVWHSSHAVLLRIPKLMLVVDGEVLTENAIT